MPGEADGFSCPLPLFGASFEPATLDLPGAGIELPVEEGGIVGKGRAGGAVGAGAGRDHGAGAGAGTTAAPDGFAIIGVWV